jgi:hypothetical protein
MSGRGENSKTAVPARGAGDQTSRGLKRADIQGKAGHRERTGGKLSVKPDKNQEQSSNRNINVDKKEK